MLPQVISMILSRECGDWIDEKVEARTYASGNHALEILVLEGTQKK